MNGGPQMWMLIDSAPAPDIRDVGLHPRNGLVTPAVTVLRTGGEGATPPADRLELERGFYVRVNVTHALQGHERSELLTIGGQAAIPRRRPDDHETEV